MPRPNKVIIEPAKGGPGWDVTVEGRKTPVAHSRTKVEAEGPARAKLAELGEGS